MAAADLARRDSPDSEPWGIEDQASIVLYRDSQPVFRLLDLPPEIWSKICFHAVTHGIIRGENDYRTVPRAFAQPDLSHVCTRIRVETLKHFYGENEFQLYDRNVKMDRDIKEWASAIWTTWWPSIKKFTVKSGSHDILEHLREGLLCDFDSDAPRNRETVEMKITQIWVKGFKYEDS